MSTQTSASSDWRASALANLLVAKKRHGRIGSKKSKTGCVNCKSRRIKCDERRPVCERCSHSRRVCVYADDTARLSAASDDSSSTDSGLSSKSSNIHLTLGRQLSLPPCPEQDSRTLDYFLSWAAPRLAGSLDQDLWCGKVLVLAQTEPVIRDGLLALSVLYEHPQYMKSFLIAASGGDYATPEDHPNLASRAGGRIDMHHAQALRYYNRSMRMLRDDASSGKGSPTLALLSCVIFIAIELIRDSVFSALTLLNHGVRLLRQLSVCPGSIDESLFSSVKLMMSRLGVLAAIYGHPQPLRMLRDITKERKNVAFASLSDARAALSTLMGEIFSLEQEPDQMSNSEIVGESTQHPNRQTSDGMWHSMMQSPKPESFRIHYGCEQRVPSSIEFSDEASSRVESLCPSDATPYLQERQCQLISRLTQWHAEFKKIQNTDEQAACSLLMLYHVSFVTVSASLSSTQSVFDQYTYNFQEILLLAEIFFRGKQTEQATFTFEVGAIGPLSFVATKCRIPSIRRRALHVMSKGPKKESTFSAKSVSELATRLIAIEEECLSLPEPTADVHLSLIDDSVLPPEQCRVHNYELIINKAAGRHDVRVTRYVIEPTGRTVKSVVDYPI